MREARKQFRNGLLRIMRKARTRAIQEKVTADIPVDVTRKSIKVGSKQPPKLRKARQTRDKNKPLKITLN
jgi:thiamine pyrophosphate-dependent acetolactate synthase large subunit-like protein